MPSVGQNAPALPLPVLPAGEWLPAHLIPLAAELVGTVRDYGAADQRKVLARVPAGQWRDFATVLAAMVDPDQRPHQLLAWTRTPPPSRDVEPLHLMVARASAESPDHRVNRIAERRAEVARLTAQGYGPAEIAQRLGITPRCVSRHKKALREQGDMPPARERPTGRRRADCPHCGLNTRADRLKTHIGRKHADDETQAESQVA